MKHASQIICLGIVFVFSAALLSVGCAEGGSENGGDDQPDPDVSADTQLDVGVDAAPDVAPDMEPDMPMVDPPEITNFEVAESDYAVGDMVTLQWTLGGGPVDSLTVMPNVGDVTGQSSVMLEATAGDPTYTLTATNAAGEDTATVTLMPNPAPPSIDNFGVNPNSIQVGEQVTFSWSVSTISGESITCSIDTDGDGTDEYTLGNCMAQTIQTHRYFSSGTKNIEFSATTASSGESTDSATVTVNGSSQVVTNTSDSGQGSLRAAVSNASDGDVILFDLQSYPATITLQSAVEITSDITVRAANLGDVVLDAQGTHRVFDLDGQGAINLTIENMELANGQAPYVTDSSGNPQSTDGGLLRGQGTLTIDNSHFHDATAIDTVSGGSQALGDGGCLDWTGDVSIIGSEFNNCSANFGGAMNVEESVATIESSYIHDNSAPTGNGGCCYFSGTLDLVSSTVANNQGNSDSGSYGGAFYLAPESGISGPRGDQSSLFLNSTIYGNAASDTGGVALLEAPLHVVFSTVTNNEANSDIAPGYSATNDAGAFWGLGGGEVRLHHSIVSGNSADNYPDIEAVVTVSGTNFVGHTDTADSDLSGMVNTSAPQLGTLGQNGGQTPTVMPQTGSPVIDAAGNCNDHTGAMLGTDQRGTSRPQGSNCDVGAVEVQ